MDDFAAELAYLAYAASVGWKSVSGDELPLWDALTEPVKRGWRAAANAAKSTGPLGEVHNHYSTYYGIQKPYRPYSPPSWSGGWVTATSDVNHISQPCTVA